ncbi:MAG TPA: autotransporter assembly complex family protein [Acetobacteraceae bacterium]|nr:autotransporter assembly complex family protein [Acetobacteraceae bacterium]
MRRILAVLTVVAWLVGSNGVIAADPQPYSVTLKPTGNKTLDSGLHDASSLISLQDKAPVGGFALVERARQDVDRFQTVLRSYGYYAAKVDLTIAGHPITDPDLPDIVSKLPAEPKAQITASFSLGAQFHLGNISIKGAVPTDARDKLGLASGAPAIASDVLAARDRLLNAIREDGYPLARVDLEPVTLRPSDNAVDVVFDAATGPRADIGPIQIDGLQAMHEDFVRRRLLIHQGEQFRPSAIDAARQDLMSLGVFSQVRMEPAGQLDAQGDLPITVDVSERKLHSVDLGVAYSTDLGINVNAGWHDRNLFGNAEQLNLTAMADLGGTAVAKPGYRVGAQFLKPDFLARDQQLELDLTALKQSLKAYDQEGFIEQALLNRKFSPHWSGSVGLLGEQERVTQEGIATRYNLLGVPIVVRYDSTNNQFDPTEGIRASVGITPTESLGGKTATFFVMQASGSTYIDVSGGGRSVVALRGLVGKIAGADVFSLPPDQRFYAGGSSTVRGYRYQSIGPQFADGNPTGGTAISAGTIEFRQRFLESYGVVGFVDAGQVTANGAPFTSTPRIGAGIGVRYYTSIGPIRADFAVPLNKQPGGDRFELYLGLGQAF